MKYSEAFKSKMVRKMTSPAARVPTPWPRKWACTRAHCRAGSDEPVEWQP